MQREDFFKAIDTVGSALGRGDIHAALADLWFDGKTVAAFDENVGISTPCAFDLVGGIKGDKLLGMVGKTRPASAEVLVTVKDTNATIKIGKRVTIKVAVNDPANRIWQPKEANPSAAIKVKPALLIDGLAHCLKSVGQDLSQPEYYGVTFQVEGNYLHIYTGYRNHVIVEAVVPLKAKPAFTRVVVPEKFCQHVVKHFATKGATLELHDVNGGLLVTPNRTVYGRALNIAGNGVDMKATVAKQLKSANGFLPFPKGGILRMLERAALFEGDHLNMRLELERCAGGVRLRMVSGGKASGTELVDVSNRIEADVEPVQVMTNAKHLLSGAELKEFDINTSRIVIRDERDGVRITQMAGVDPAK